MVHLVAFTSGEQESENWKRWLPVQERAAGELFDAQDLTDEQRTLRSSVRFPARLTFGDSGGVYIFVRTRCPGMPYTCCFDG